MIGIIKDPNGDTRTANGDIDFATFHKANARHREDVANAMDFLASEITYAGASHDHTKTGKDEEEFYKEFNEYRKTGEDFKNSPWYQMHIREEKHHLNSYVHKDVDLIDVLEMIADCVCAGLARSGEVRPIEISPDVLALAVQNTADLIEKQCVLIDMMGHDEEEVAGRINEGLLKGGEELGELQQDGI